MRPLVLLVDDSALVTGALRLLLEETGFRVAEAARVDEALAQIGAERPAIVLLDLTLADEDGLELLDRLRARGDEPPPAVAVTGHDDDATRARCLAAGCLDVLVKPIAPMQLPGRIRQWLASRNGAHGPAPDAG